MTWMSPSYAKKLPNYSATGLVISPNLLEIIEPVVAGGEVVFAGDPGDPDIVMAPMGTITLTLEP